jgi:hypothetical protein
MSEQEAAGHCSLCGQPAENFPDLIHIHRYLYRDKSGRAHDFGPTRQLQTEEEKIKRRITRARNRGEAPQPAVDEQHDNSIQEIADGTGTGEAVNAD